MHEKKQDGFTVTGSYISEKILNHLIEITERDPFFGSSDIWIQRTSKQLWKECPIVPNENVMGKYMNDLVDKKILSKRPTRFYNTGRNYEYKVNLELIEHIKKEKNCN